MVVVFSRPSEWICVEGSCYELGHTWQPYCVLASLEVFAKTFLAALKIYVPLFLISDVLSRRRPSQVVLSTLPNILRSSLFLGVNGGMLVTSICFFRRLFGRFYFYSTGLLPGIIASLSAILVERKSRRSMLSVYVCSIAAETLYTMAKYRKWISPLPYGEVVLFCFASSVLLSAYRSKKGLHDAVGSILRLLFAPLRMPQLKSFCSTPLSSVTRDAIALTLWPFLLGYCLQTTLSLISSLKSILRHPSHLKKCLLKRYSFKFGGFLAALTTGFKLLNVVLLFLPISRELRLALSGAVAGLAMCFIRSSSISVYAAGKALEVLYYHGVDKGWLRNFYYGDVVLYVIGTSILLHTAMLEGHNIRPSYYTFLHTITSGRISELKYNSFDVFGTETSKCNDLREKLLKSQGRKPVI